MSGGGGARASIHIQPDGGTGMLRRSIRCAALQRIFIHEALKSLQPPRAVPICRATLHCTKGVTQMIALIEKFLDAMFAPLVRDLERLPPQAMRFGVFF
jgi:hypothetical protein